MYKIYTWKRKDGSWTWRMVAPNGRIVADGGGHNTRAMAIKSTDGIVQAIRGWNYMRFDNPPPAKKKAKKRAVKKKA